jgi:deoxyribonucleoside regulator
MAPDRELTATLVQVATLYYEENKSQQEIADQLGVSRSLIALYLKRAREQNIVRIEIVNPQDMCEDLALAIQEQSTLRGVHVIPTPANRELAARALAGVVARYLEACLQDGDRVGLGWGRTIQEIVGLLAPARPRRIEVVPLLGESSFTGTYTQMNQIVLRFAAGFDAQPHFLLLPLLVGTPALRDALLRDDAVRPITDRWQALDLICAGVGALPSSPGQIVYLGEANVQAYIARGAVGDLVARHFDATGAPVRTGLDDRIIGIEWEQLRRARTVLAVVSGREKAHALRGALRTGLITDLFIDQELAEAVLALSGEAETGRS